MEDHIVKATAVGGTVRVMAAVTTEMVREAGRIHGLLPVASAALGRTLTAAAMMSGSLKGEKDTITLQIKGDGPLGTILAISDVRANVRGYLHNPDVYLPLNEAGKLDVAAAVGKNGYLNVIKDLGLREPYSGSVDLVSGEIGDDITYYFMFSEQVPSVVALGVLVAPDGDIIQAGGYIIQLMPGAEEYTISYIENTVASIPAVTQLLSCGESPESILDIIFGHMDLRILDKVPCSYKCNCTRERLERSLISLGEKDIRELIEEEHGAELTCQFCNSRYNFSEQELRDLLANIKRKP